MALTNLTGTEWVFNDTLNFPSDGFDYSINFQSNNQNFSKMQVSKLYPNDLKYVGVDSSNTLWPYEGSWMAPLYKTISITDGTDATNSTLINWLKANATWTNQPQGVSISYSGSEIATMEESGTKTLLTSGKYCESDIIVEYTKPTPNLQEKTVTPTTEQQIVTPDSIEYTYELSEGLQQAGAGTGSMYFTENKIQQVQYFIVGTSYKTEGEVTLSTGTVITFGYTDVATSSQSGATTTSTLQPTYDYTGPTEISAVGLSKIGNSYVYLTIEYTGVTEAPTGIITKKVQAYEDGQTIYDGLSKVTVNAMPSGTAGTPTATKGTVSNHSISVTPSVTNTTGYITGSTINGTAVTVDVTELESGTKSITENGTGISVSGYSAVDVDVAGQEPTGVKYVYTDIDGVNAYNVSGFEKVSVDYAGLLDDKFRLWVETTEANTTFSFSVQTSDKVYCNADWGDGTSEDFVSAGSSEASTVGVGYTKTISHTYVAPGRYCAVVSSTGNLIGGITCQNNSYLKGVEIASYVSQWYSSNLFNGCPNLESITFPASNTDTTSTPSQYTCRGLPSLKRVVFNSPASSIPCFESDVSLEELTLPGTVGVIAGSTFSGCKSLRRVNGFGTSSITTLPQYIFDNCSSLLSVTIPQSITSFGSSTFAGSSIMSITIPQNVTDLGRSVFQNCTYLKEVHLLPTTPPTISASMGMYYDPFKNTHPDLVLYVPQGYLSAYQSATNWSSYASIMQEEQQ